MINLPALTQPKIETIQIKVEVVKPKDITYQVVDGDTLTGIATAHQTTVERLWAANTNLSNPDLIEPGTRLRVPKKDEELTERALPVYTIPANVTSYHGTVNTQGPGTNLFTFGNCTFFVASQRYIPNSWGDASEWYWHAQQDGWATGATPKVGAVAWTKAYGHVSLVIGLNKDGSVHVREMNYTGFNQISERDAPASDFLYIY